MLEKLIGENPELSRSGDIFVSGAEEAISYSEASADLSRELEENSFWFSHRRNCIRDLVGRVGVENGAFFDVGGGNGFVSVGLQEDGLEAAVIEPIASAAKAAAGRGVKWVVAAPLAIENFPAASVPAVGLFDVIEHIEDDLGFLKKVHELMIPGERVFITVPAYSWLWSVNDKVAGHFRRYTVSGLKRVLKEAGFEPVFATYIFGFLPLPVFLARALPSKFGLLKAESDPERSHQEHSGGASAARKIVDILCSLERWIIQKGFRLMTGGSCMIAAKKVDGRE